MRNFFQLPDKEKDNSGYMLNSLIVIWSVVILLIISMGFIFLPQVWYRWLVLLGILVFLAIFHFTLNRLGYRRFASWSFVIMLWLLITLPCYSAGGIMAPGILTQLSVILTAGFLLGWRGGLIFGFLSIFADFGFVYLEMNDMLPAPNVVHTPLTRWIGAIIPFGTILALQYYATNHLRTALEVMQKEISKREDAEKIKNKTLFELEERVKELKTLYAVSNLLRSEIKSFDHLFQDIVNILPSGWRFSDITAAKLCVGDRCYTTSNFEFSEISLYAEKLTLNETKISVEIVYLKNPSIDEEEPFINEEKSLLNLIVEMLITDLERKEREEELQDYKYAIDLTSIVSISDVKGIFTFVNANFCEVSKYSSEELIGKDHSLLWSGEHSADYFESLEHVLEKGKPFGGEFCNKAKDGSLYWVYATIIPFLDDKGKVYQYLTINHDITQRKKAENEIKEQADLFQAIIENTKESIYLISPEFKILQFNNTAKKRMQLTRGKEIYLGADYRDYLFEDTKSIFHSMFGDSLNGIYRFEEIRSEGVNGNYFWFQSKTSPVYDLKGNLIGIRLLIESIDDRKNAEVVLRESEQKFRSIVEQSMVGIYIIQNGTLVYVNPGFEKIFGYKKKELLNKMSFDGLVHEDDLDEVNARYTKRVKHQKTKEQYTFKAIKKDGTILYLEVIASLINFRNEPAVIGTLLNVTDRVEEERRINQAVLNAQEKERLQLGMELHDNVQQILTATGLYLQIAQSSMDDKAAVMAILDNLITYNTEGINELRSLSHLLAPLIEENSDLNDKIEWLIKSLKLTETLDVSIKIAEFTKPIDANIQLNFYRILQEQLGNIRKYAEASKVVINIWPADNIIHLQIKDNGIGFSTSAKKEGIGLENIRRRVQILSGKVDIISSPGKGCEVHVQVPMVLN